MANPFTKAWRYLMALFDSKIDENADPKVQIQQAIADAHGGGLDFDSVEGEGTTFRLAVPLWSAGAGSPTT